jgi:hypothetical protein
MGVGKIIHQDKVKKTDRDTYWVEVGGSPVDTVPLKKSREVALEPLSRTMVRKGYKSYIEPSEFRANRHKERSARVTPESGGVTDSGIQIYRLWFYFLKLALELEDLGVTKLVTKQIRVRKDIWNPESGQRVSNTRAGSFYQLKDTIPFKIKQEKYDGWDLDQVLKDPFDKWWKTHSYLFEGHAPSIIKTSGNLDPDFLYIRIDKTSKLGDVRDFITAEVQSQLTGKPRFKVDGYPRPDVIQNHYNALVLTLKGWSAQDICTGGPKEAIYLRATDTRSKGDRLAVSVVTIKTTGAKKTIWSKTVSTQRNYGLHHLQEVMKGKFGGVPDKGIE